MKFTQAMKDEAVERVMKGAPSYVVALNIDAQDAQVRDWCKKAGFSPPKTVHDEAIIKAATGLIKDGHSMGAVTAALGISRFTLLKWLGGKAPPKVVKERRKRRDIANDEKLAAVARVKAGEAVSLVAAEMDVAHSLIRRWMGGKGIAKVSKGGTPGVTKLESGRNSYAIEYKTAAVDRLDAGETVTEVAKDIGISTGLLVNWRDQVHRRAAPEVKQKRKYTKRDPTPTSTPGQSPMTLLAIRDAITYLKHVKNDMYGLLQAGVIKEFEEYHLNVLAALKRLQSIG